MLTDPLPKTLDVRKAAARGVSVSGMLNPTNLLRFRSLLAEDNGHIQVDLSFSRDEEGRFIVKPRIKASFSVICQRCLESMVSSLDCENTLAVVWTDEQAGQLPRHLDALILGDEDGDLWQLVEDELILNLPAYQYHEQQDCNTILTELSASTDVSAESDERPNPFDVLAQLKPSKKH